MNRAGRKNAKHLTWMRRQDCCVRGCQEPAVPHHVRTAANSGTGLKPADKGWTLPLCHTHHTEGHDRGWRTFQQKYNLDLGAEAAFYARTSGTEMP